MPCYSSIATKLTNSERLTRALSDQGYDVAGIANTVTGTKDGRSIRFTRTGQTFSASGDVRELAGISRRYAEIGVREFAKRTGYAVASNDNGKITLINRRG